MDELILIISLGYPNSSLGVPVFKEIHIAYRNNTFVEKYKFLFVQVDGRDTLQMKCIVQYLICSNSHNKLLYFLKVRNRDRETEGQILT